ncbi:MAG: ATP-binding protein [Patescibacteria group bacterium]|nr:ATP-binding protein [Patescibacteria group bacterium]MCL5262174.1 ATP-binding protein [Patescibacteria group bacterium]
MDKIFSQIKGWWRSPQMTGFWFFLAAGILNLVIAISYLTGIWLWLDLAAVVVTGVFVFRAGYRAMRESRQAVFNYRRLQSIVSNLSDGIISYDNNLEITEMNAAAEQIFNIQKDKVIGKKISPEWGANPELKLLAQVVFPSLAPTVVKRSEPGVYPQVVDISFVEPDIEIRVSTDRITTDKGEVLGFVKVVHDRTREIELLRSKSEFITVAAHQLRTPLTAVRWALENINIVPNLDPNIKELTATGLSASGKLMKIIEDLLNTSKIEEGRFGYEFQDMDIVAFLEEALSGVQAIAKEYGVSLYFDRPADNLPVVIRMDPKRLGMAFSNLLDNAIKYNVKNGSVTVKIEKMTDRPYVRISVQDTGVGIPEEDMPKLFSKFYRGENVVRDETDGTGLGLYIAKNIILRHGGGIQAESVLNRGTTFYVFLPTDPRLIPPKEIIYGET